MYKNYKLFGALLEILTFCFWAVIKKISKTSKKLSTKVLSKANHLYFEVPYVKVETILLPGKVLPEKKTKSKKRRFKTNTYFATLRIQTISI